MISEANLSPRYSNPCPYKKSSFQPLDVSSLLIHNSLLHHEIQRNTAQPPVERRGFDNVGFDLEGLEKIEPGSRKPLVGVHVRTVSAEEFVRSTLNNQSTHSRKIDDWALEKYPRDSPIIRDTKEGILKPRVSPPNKSLSNINLSRSGRSGREEEEEEDDELSRATNNKCPSAKNYKSHSLKFNRKENVSPSKKQDKENVTEVIKNNNNDDDDDDNDVNEQNQQRLKNNKNEQLPQGHCLNIICNKSLPSNESRNEKKTDTLDAKKTGGGSALFDHEEIYGTSLAKTMVRVGGATTGISPPFSQNVSVSSPLKVVISSVGPKSTSTNVSQVCVMSNVVGLSSTKVSNVVLNGGVRSSPATSSSSTFAPSVVSALSKVSSVRIVPSPNNTPTPSVIGVNPSSSTSVAPEQVPNVPSTTTAKTATTTNNNSNKSSHSYRPFDVVKRHINNIKHNSNNDLSQQPTTSVHNQRSPHNHQQQQQQQQQQEHHQPLLGLLRGSLANQGNITNNNHNQNIQGTTQPSELLLHQKPLFKSGQPQSPQPTNQQSPHHQQQQQQPDPLRGTGEHLGVVESPTANGSSNPAPETTRREVRERRRERRERRRERRALRIAGGPQGPPGPPMQTDLVPEPPRPLPHHLPDLLNSHVPPPYSTLPNGPRSLGGLLGPPPNVGAPPPLSLQMPPPPPPPPGPPLAPFPPPAGGTHGSPIRPPIPDNQWHFFGSRRSRGSRRAHSYLGDEEAKSCCGLLVTQAVSIRWFIIMISFVGLCCTVVGTVLGAVKTSSSEYVTITLLMIGVGIVLITVSGVAWHLTSRDAPCRVMLGLAPNDSGRGETRRFMSRMAPTFGRPHHPYAAMMYPEFQYRPPPPSYQASMQEYRLRLFLLDRHGSGTQQYPGANNLPSPPPTYRSGPYNVRGMGAGTLSRESDYSRPPSYRSREGSVTHHPDAPPSIDPSGGVGGVTLAHSRDPSCLSFLSHEGSTRLRGNSQKRNANHTSSKFPVVESNPQNDTITSPSTSNKKGEKGGTAPSKDDNTVTIVQTTDCSHVIGSESVIVTVSGNELTNQRAAPNNGTEISVLAHL